MKRIQKGPVRGISLRLQEEERERRMDFVPDRSEIQIENIEVRDPVLKQMIKDLGLRKLVPGMQQNQDGKRQHRHRENRDRKQQE
mmetsp:Transcript_98071/g.134871  ORF Transcript_98071/g.134871 Transcript_98071/m.134871 type:complete len:85 (+) Transcript_98071:333-587(+)